jgi:F-type H+-transporting ATPase subunit b
MRILRLAALLLVLLSPALFAAEESEGGHGNSREMLWRVVNFALLAGGLGYLIKKNAGPMFAARSRAIETEIAEARALVEQSEARARAIEERFSGLSREIEGLRSSAKAEIAAEDARLEQEAERAVRKISALAEQEIAAVTKAARLELKSHAAALAVDLAKKKIAGRITPQTQHTLVGRFVRDLEPQRN